jgi:hypothetical protein
MKHLGRRLCRLKDLEVNFGSRLLWKSTRHCARRCFSSVNGQQTVLRFGLTGLAVLIGVGLRTADLVLSMALLLLVAPLVTFFIVAAWKRERLKIARGGAYLQGLETKINKVMGWSTPSLEWEQWLRVIRRMRHHSDRRSRPYVSTYHGELAVVGLLTIGSLGLAFYKLSTVHHLHYGPALAAATVGVAIFLISIAAYFHAAHQTNDLLSGSTDHQDSSDVSENPVTG